MSKQRRECGRAVACLAASGGSKLDQLRRRVQTGEREVRDAGDWSQRTRREAELGVVRRELEALEHDARHVQQGGTAAKQEDAAPCTLDDLVAAGSYIRSGNTYLQVGNKPRPKAPATTQPARQEQEQQFAVPQPYFDAEAQA